MPIPGIRQPELLIIDEGLRLRRFDGNYDLALPWYQDRETVLLVDGAAEPYTPERIRRMYDYLAARGELYWIEVREGEGFIPIGDVTFWRRDMPIVIGMPGYRGRGVGGRVIEALCQRARELNYHDIYVNEIYDFNAGSRRCFERAGFVLYEKTERGARYVRRLTEEER